ncbi:RNA-binding protein 25-like, partial [Trifolium medium]|nr:RNA-binding protein 25-like [Trifolium medium]
MVGMSSSISLSLSLIAKHYQFLLPRVCILSIGIPIKREFKVLTRLLRQRRGPICLGTSLGVGPDFWNDEQRLGNNASIPSWGKRMTMVGTLAKAMFNAFYHYGDIMEVVIPAKRDKLGRRFGFARFDQVDEPRRLECELDNIIIGRDKISVNLSRFQRREEYKCRDDKEAERNGKCARVTDKNTYAQAVRTGEVLNEGGRQQLIALSYEADKKDMLRLQKAFIGVVEQPGMTYNIQNAIHSQGYFGVKVTPLGSNLTLLEGQEDGEMQALLEDAK